VPGSALLFLQANSEDYLADSLLHGLRLVLGDAVVDVPRRDALYDDYPAERRGALYGRGFTLYARLAEPPGIDRSDWLGRALEGAFATIVIGDIHRNWEPWVALRPHLGRLRELGVRVAVVDGGDGPVMYPHGPTWWKRARPRPLPRAHGHVMFFKRELQLLTWWIRYYGFAPPPLAERLLRKHVRPIGFSIPEEHLATGDEPKAKLLATRVTDPEVAELVAGSALAHVFDAEADYYADLRASRFGVTTKKAGWEALRHYEIAASGCVPCFRDLARKPPTAAPFGLDESNCVPYSDPAALLATIESMDEGRYASLRAGALAWARRNTTRMRAVELLEAVGHPATASATLPA
jgi:hypothetical protein